MPTSSTQAANTSDRMSGKERILNASMLLFAQTPYSTTSLRDIAAAADVNVAYVHRAFGSKAEIFRQALQAATSLENLFIDAASGEEVIRRLCTRALLDFPKKLEDVEALHLLIQSNLCAEAREIIKQFLRESLAEPLRRAFGHDDTGRALLAISLLGGFVTNRAILGHESLQTMSETDQSLLLEAALLAVMRG